MKKLRPVIIFLTVIAIIVTAAALIRGKEPKGEYRGRTLVAGHGGHIADANIVIDPSDEDNPIKIPTYAVWTGNKLHMIPLGSASDHAIHDVRIDNQDRDTVFWSNYMAPKPYVIVGKADLKRNKWVAEKQYDLPKEVIEFGETTAKTFYCASGQSEKYFLPIFMGYPGFIDIVDKQTLDLRHRVMLASNPEMPINYRSAHGASSPDNKYLYIILNDADEPHGYPSGRQHMFLLDIRALEQGEIKIVKRNTIDFPDGTISFRASYTPDGKYILQSARTRTIVIRADDLTLYQEANVAAGQENHDLVATADGKYGISTLRVPIYEEGKKVQDGMIQLYDIVNNKYIGRPLSVCRQCHNKREKHSPLVWGMKLVGCTRCHQDERSVINLAGDNILCGIDAQWKN